MNPKSIWRKSWWRLKIIKKKKKWRQRGKKDQPPKLLCYIKWLKNVFSFLLFWKCQKFGSVGRRETEKKKGMALGALNKLLKTQASEVSPSFYENSLRLGVYNIMTKIPCHCRGTSKTSWANGLKKAFVRSHFRAKQRKKSTFSLCPKEYRLLLFNSSFQEKFEFHSWTKEEPIKLLF